LREKNVILLELNEFFLKWNRNKEDYKHIHIIRYVSEDGNNGNVWDGKVQMISNMVKNMEKNLVNQFNSKL
jgi:hypothetical protein